MGILTSILMPLLKTGATIGAAAIPGIGPIAAPVVGGLLSAGQGLASGQGPLTSIGSGAIGAGMSYGMGQLGDLMQGPAEGVADTSQFAGSMSLMDDPADDFLTSFAKQDLWKKMSMMQGRGF